MGNSNKKLRSSQNINQGTSFKTRSVPLPQPNLPNSANLPEYYKSYMEEYYKNQHCDRVIDMAFIKQEIQAKKREQGLKIAHQTFENTGDKKTKNKSFLTKLYLCILS